MPDAPQAHALIMSSLRKAHIEAQCLRVYIARGGTDMRKSINGLSLRMVDHMNVIDYQDICLPFAI